MFESQKIEASTIRNHSSFYSIPVCRKDLFSHTDFATDGLLRSNLTAVWFVIAMPTCMVTRMLAPLTFERKKYVQCDMWILDTNRYHLPMKMTCFGHV